MKTPLLLGSIFSLVGTLLSTATAAEAEPAADKLQMPEVLVESTAAYPRELQMRGVEGLVVVEGVLSRHGHLLAPTVVESTHPEFATAALAMVKRWEFQPALRGDQAVDVYVRIPIRFQLLRDGSGRVRASPPEAVAATR